MHPAGVAKYLTNIVSSSLSWIEDEDERETIWNLASLRLSERAGRTAMPAITRTFAVAEDLSITLHEPSLTGDDLGLKTWTSSLLMSRHLRDWRPHLPLNDLRILELGAGTGLVGITAACLWQADVTLSDLAAIVPNLNKNLDMNREKIQAYGGGVRAITLDWSDANSLPADDNAKFSCIMAADPIYSAEHPRILVETISRWIDPKESSRVLIELPLRRHYTQERSNLCSLLREIQFDLVDEGIESGLDDWFDKDGNRADVECWWSVWRYVSKEQP